MPASVVSLAAAAVVAAESIAADGLSCFGFVAAVASAQQAASQHRPIRHSPEESSAQVDLSCSSASREDSGLLLPEHSGEQAVLRLVDLGALAEVAVAAEPAVLVAVDLLFAVPAAFEA